MLLDCSHASMGLSRTMKLDYIVMVDAVAYYQMNYNDKSMIAKAIGEINWRFRNQGKHLMLLVPGRVGTSSPELGVPTAFSDISEFDVVCEISESRAGYLPELSYGSHIFQDLVEAGILYVAVFENEKTRVFRPDRLKELDNKLLTYYPKGEEIQDIIGVYDVSDRDSLIYHDMAEERFVCLL